VEQLFQKKIFISTKNDLTTGRTAEGGALLGSAPLWRGEAACAAGRVPSDDRPTRPPPPQPSPTKEEHARFTRRGGSNWGQ